MAGYDGAGNYVLRYNFQTDAANGVKILASRQDQMWQDMAGAFGNCLTRDAQGKPAADMDWNAKRLTNLGAATTGTDAAQLQQVLGVGVRGSGNMIVNPAFSVWQRGAPITPAASGAYTADHWYLRRSLGVQTGLTAKQNVSDGGNPFGTSIGFGRAAGDTGTDTVSLRGVIESIDARKITGYHNNTTNVVTIVSCYLKAGTTLPSSTLNFLLYSNPTADAAPWNASWHAEALAVIGSGSLSTSAYTRVSVVLAGSPFTNLASVMVELTVSDTQGTAGADDLLYCTGMKLEQQINGSANTITPFEPNSYEQDLARCMRYYQVLGQGASNTLSWTGRLNAADLFDNTVVLPVPMHHVPTATVTGTWAVTRFAGNPSVVTGNNASIIVRNTCNSTGAVAQLCDTTDDGITLLAELAN